MLTTLTVIYDASEGKCFAGSRAGHDELFLCCRFYDRAGTSLALFALACLDLFGIHLSQKVSRSQGASAPTKSREAIDRILSDFCKLHFAQPSSPERRAEEQLNVIMAQIDQTLPAYATRGHPDVASRVRPPAAGPFYGQFQVPEISTR
jgi:hypothetical protein